MAAKIYQYLRNRQLWIFICLMLLGISISVYQKEDLTWDFLNYHYYNAYAFITGRFGYDIVPSSINGFFNPIIDLPLYFYIKYFNNNLSLIYALQGIWGGLLFYVFYLILSLFFDVKNNREKFYMIVAFLLGITGQATYFQIGMSTNEIPVAFMILLGLYHLLKMIKYPDTQKLRTFLLAGLLMGIALGLKQTVISYCLGSGLMLIVCYKYLKNPFKCIFLFALGGLLGYLLINGYFMYKYTVDYGNPFFPFLNGIFHSPYFDDFNYRDDRFLPTIDNAFYYPYLWNEDIVSYIRKVVGYFNANFAKKIEAQSIAEITNPDYRLTIYYAVYQIVFIYALLKIKTIREKTAETALYLFIILSFIIWLFIFSILRYAVILEMLSAVLFVFVCKHRFFKNRYLDAIWQVFFLSIAALLISNPFWPHNKGWDRKDGNYYVYVEPVQLPDNTLLKLYNFPVAAIIPEFAKYNNNFRAVGYLHDNYIHHEGTDFVERGKFRKIRDGIEKNHRGPVIIVYNDTSFFPKKSLKEHIEYEKLCKDSYNLIFNSNISIEERNKAIIQNVKCDSMKYICQDWTRVFAALSALDLEQYYCRPLHTNVSNRLKICVPYNLKNQILRSENE